MESTLIDVWDNTQRSWPNYIYVETTNRCDAACKSCVNHKFYKKRGVMTMDTFEKICHKVKSRGMQIGAMFCFGNPLLDPTIIKKFKMGNSMGLFPSHIGLNTTTSLLTDDRFVGILDNVPNIILSFFNTGKEFENLTGLNWETCYNNAINFIKFRDMYKPGFPIFIGCNTVKGYNLNTVKKAFEGYNVGYVQDAELRWAGSVVTGVLDRTIMYNDWRCDGFKGALQVKWNGDCEFCAYDITSKNECGETKFGNILEDSWDELRRKFIAKWKQPSTLCSRCDYFHHAKVVIANGCKRPSPLPSDWYDWQKPFLQEGESYAD